MVMQVLDFNLLLIKYDLNVKGIAIQSYTLEFTYYRVRCLEWGRKYKHIKDIACNRLSTVSYDVYLVIAGAL